MTLTASSEYTIRFSDCDPFGHLNNARYIDYFLHAREEHLRQTYDLDLQQFYQQGMLWVVGSHEIIYLKPAVYAEKVAIQSTLIQLSEDQLMVEMVMRDTSKGTIKSILWTRFFPINAKTGKKEKHTAAFMELARPMENKTVDIERGIMARIQELAQ